MSNNFFTDRQAECIILVTRRSRVGEKLNQTMRKKLQTDYESVCGFQSAGYSVCQMSTFLNFTSLERIDKQVDLPIRMHL
ncbi:hypothetical protein T07_10464 [Trichinella nelsoni]|uniref:Uncharacterized protein n=1 Tax=Trichinella nelsoni TaxID=6336 RepID=A0A0V0SII2_9BILA|nr:hypothetical protein T07_10464 [Trichinella nelsoni]